MKVTIPLIALAGSPLPESLRPQNTDEKHLDYHINRIRQVKQGIVSIEVDHDYLNEGTQEENCLIKLSTDHAKATMELMVSKGNGWHYNAAVEFNDGEKRQYKGTGEHDSKNALVRKVQGLIKIMLKI